MTRVLLVCPEPLGHRHPAGVGIRFLEFARALVAERHEVTVLSPDGGAVPGCASAPITPARLRRETEDAHVAVVQGHVSNELFAHGVELPTVVDLYDPFIIENLHYAATHGDGVFRHDHVTLTGSLRQGDFFLCASPAQRLFYLGLLLAAGRLNPELFASDPRLESLLAIVPFGVPPPPPDHVTPGNGALLFGGIYDWYDPILAIDAVAEARRHHPPLTLTFTLHPNPETTPQGKAAAALAHVKKHGYVDFVRFLPWVPYDERLAFYRRFDASLLTFPQSLETELAMRTRLFDYLWGGLPILTSAAPGTDDILDRYGAGVILRTSEASEIAAALLSLFRKEGALEELSRGARQYARDHQWSRLLGPLLAFCRSPRRETLKNRYVDAAPQVEERRSMLQSIRRRLGGKF